MALLPVPLRHPHDKPTEKARALRSVSHVAAVYINPLNKPKKMPKVKTNSGAKKRFSLTGTGKIKRRHAYHSHILTKKTKKQKRNLDHVAIVDSSNVRQVRELLCLR